MPIEHHKGGTTLTGDSIWYFRMCAMLNAVRLEVAGITVRRGRRVWTQARREFNIKGGRDAVLRFLEVEVARLQAQQEHVIEGRRYVNGEEVQ